MNILIAFGVAGLVGFGSYVLGLRRGIKISKEESCEEYKNAYWDGYSDGRLDPASHIVGEAYEEGFQDGKEATTKKYKTDKLIEGLDELFKDGDGIIDCGEY